LFAVFIQIVGHLLIEFRFVYSVQSQDNCFFPFCGQYTFIKSGLSWLPPDRWQP